MKNAIKLGIIALAAVIGFAMTACPDGGSTHTHSYNATWSFNGTQHWRECTANDGAKTDVANHDGDPCTICDYDSSATSVTFTSVTANGSATATTTTLTLTFSQAITGLSATDIALSGVAGVSKGTLSGTGPAYTLPVSVTAGGSLSVAVSKPGYNISGSPKPVTVYCYTKGGEGPQGDKGADGLPGEEGPVGPAGPVYITVTYDLNEGTRIGGPIAPQRVLTGGKVTMPLRGPTKVLTGDDGGLDYLEPGLYATTNGALAQPFEAWDLLLETDEDGVPHYREWDFDNDVVTSDITLVARFGQPAAEVLGAGWIPATDNGFPAAAFSHINTPARAGEYILMLPGEDESNNPMVYTGVLPQLTQQNIVLFIRSRGIGGTAPVAAIKDADDNVLVPQVAGIPPTPAVVTFVKPATAGSILLHVGAGGNGSGSNVRVVIGRNIVLQGSTNNKPAVVISGGATLEMEGFNLPAGTGPYDYNAPKITGNTNTYTNDDFRTTGTNMYSSTGAAVGVYSGTLIMRGDSIVTGNNAGTNSTAGIGWYGIRTSGVFVYQWGTLGMLDNAKVEKNHYTTLPTLATGSITTGNLLTHATTDVFIDKVNGTAATPRGTLNMRGNAHIGILSLADYGGNVNTNTTFVNISGAMSGTTPIRVNLWRSTQATADYAEGANYWQIGSPVLRGVNDHAVDLTDASRFHLQLRTGYYNDSTVCRTQGGFTIGTSGNASLELKN